MPGTRLPLDNGHLGLDAKPVQFDVWREWFIGSGLASKVPKSPLKFVGVVRVPLASGLNWLRAGQGETEARQFPEDGRSRCIGVGGHEFGDILLGSVVKPSGHVD